ncbi:unnamed protein product [Leptosia nina]|uniref:Uncharacterized protein n=1 Tax=Leptosia nina TaxID=320188 RepID=A0AAV1JKY5_9NEOP
MSSTRPVPLRGRLSPRVVGQGALRCSALGRVASPHPSPPAYSLPANLHQSSNLFSCRRSSYTAAGWKQACL